LIGALFGLSCGGNGAQAEPIVFEGSPADLQGVPPGYDVVRTNADNLFSTASADGNSVTINVVTGSNPYHVFGGISNSFLDDRVVGVTGNMVTLTAGTVGYFLLGGYGYSSDDGVSTSVTDNHVVAGAGRVTNDLRGGYARSVNSTGTATVEGNLVDITGGTFSRIYGGYAQSDSGTGIARGNIVNISGESITATGDKSVYGAYATGGMFSLADNNSVSISGGTFSSVVGGEATHRAAQNEVTIENATVTGNIHGAVVGANSAAANQNVVNLTNVTAVNVYGAFVGMHGSSANENVVNIHSGQFTNVYGAQAQSGDTNPGNLISNNTVNIYGGTITGAVYGGWIANRGEVFGNTVNQYGEHLWRHGEYRLRRDDQSLLQ
jgi:hypothetical protein